MQTRYVDGLTIRPLRNGDTDTVSTLFERLGARSRERRFCGAKPRLGDAELVRLARVDARHHVLVGYVSGDGEPVGMARLVRDERVGVIIDADDPSRLATQLAEAARSREQWRSRALLASDVWRRRFAAERILPEWSGLLAHDTIRGPA